MAFSRCHYLQGGDAKHMAKDVDTSLRDLIMEYSGCVEDGAKNTKSSIQDGR